mgnify:CR=1 FL=1
MELGLSIIPVTPGIYDVFYSLDTKALVPGIPWENRYQRGEGPGSAELLRVNTEPGYWTNRHHVPGLHSGRGIFVGASSSTRRANL